MKHLYIALFFVVFALSCKKPKSGEYTYDEVGVKSSYLSESAEPYNLTSRTDINTSDKVKIKNKKNTTLNINDIPWNINGDSATYRGNTSTTSSVNSSFRSSYSYCGLITGKKTIEGTFRRVQVTHSYFNIYIDSTSGTFKYTRK